MSEAIRINGDLRITGDLAVNGNMPPMPRTQLLQDSLQVYAVPLTDLRVHDAPATPLPGTSATDDLALIGVTPGTDSFYVSTQDVKTTSPTRYARFTKPLPAEYVAGETVILRFSAGMKTTVADGSAVLDAECWKADRDTAVGTDICATAQQSINSLTFADLDFVITPTGLSPGDMLDVRLKIAVVDTATLTAVIAAIGAIELLVDIKG